jgi:hypothetical protein
MTVIAQAYFHFSPFDNGIDIDSLGEAAARLAREDASEVFRFPVEVTVELEEGSLKGWITAGSLIASIFNLSAATLTTINNYPAFKSHLSMMMGDARRFSSSFNDRFIAKNAVPKMDIVRTERRTKTIGKIWRAIGELEFIAENSGKLSNRELQERDAHIRSLLSDAISDLSAEDSQILSDVLRKRFPKAIPDLMPRVARGHRSIAPIHYQPELEDDPNQPDRDLSENDEVMATKLSSGQRRSFVKTIQVLPPSAKDFY